MLRLDLHVHTMHSQDGRIRIDELIRRCRPAGLDGFAITDHDTLGGVSEALEKRGDLTVVPGVEVSARGAHVLALDVREPIPPGLSLAETVDRIREQGAVAVIAHPHSLLKPAPRDSDVMEARFDAVEVANSSHIPFGWLSRRNAALANRLRLPVTGGSDAHVLEVVGRAYTIVEADSRTVGDVVNSIRKGRTDAGGRGVSVLEKLKKIGS